jgi:hypothetical protein
VVSKALEFGQQKGEPLELDFGDETLMADEKMG